jgi:hypothetical protein
MNNRIPRSASNSPTLEQAEYVKFPDVFCVGKME